MIYYSKMILFSAILLQGYNRKTVKHLDYWGLCNYVIHKLKQTRKMWATLLSTLTDGWHLSYFFLQEILQSWWKCYLRGAELASQSCSNLSDINRPRPRLISSIVQANLLLRFVIVISYFVLGIVAWPCWNTIE